MKTQRFLTRASWLSGLVAAALVVVAACPSSRARADELVSLDDPPASPTAKAAPGTGAPAPAADLDSLDGTRAAPGGQDEEVSLDLGTGGESGGAASPTSFFNPYSFARNPLWIFLPIFGLLIVTLHLIPVPKRRAKKKIDQAQRFFRGLNGNTLGTGIHVRSGAESPAASSEQLEIVQASDRAPDEGGNATERRKKARGQS